MSRNEDEIKAAMAQNSRSLIEDEIKAAMTRDSDRAARARAESDRVGQQLAEARRRGQASYFYEQLLHLMKEFDKELDQAHEVGVRLVSFGSEIVFHVEYFGCWAPNLFIFEGKKTDGTPVRLIQHVSQVSFLLTALPRANPNEPKKPFGFQTDHLAPPTGETNTSHAARVETPKT